MAGARELKKPPVKRRTGPIIAAAVVGVLAGAYLGLCAWAGGMNVMPNVTLAGQDLSQVEDIQGWVEQKLADQGQNAVVTLKYGDWSGSISGDQLQPFGENTALNAMQAGESGFLTRGVKYIASVLGGGTEVALDLGLDGKAQPALEALLDQAEQAIGCDTAQADYRLEGDRLVMVKGQTGLRVDREKAKEAVFQVFEEDVLPKAFQGEQSEETVELTIIDSPAPQPDFGAIHAAVCVQPENAGMDPETHEIIPHVNGVSFETAALQAAYESAAEGETFSIPVTLTAPEETTDSFNAKLFRDLLGEGSSQVSGSANRKFNVKLSAEACNNIILMPGEEFSYNNTTGSRSADKGYLPAPVYSGGQSVDETGGGICQTSSTIYYAMLHTTLEVVERSAHMYATGYVKDGMDATVYFGALDFRFKNNTDYPIKLVTQSYDQNGKRYLKAQIYGTNVDGRYAKPERIQYDWIEPTNKYVADETIPQGTTKVDEKQNPYTGRTAQCFRYVYEKDGTLVEKQDMGISKYKMRPRTIYYNPLDGDPTTWVDGKPPQPVTQQPDPTPSQPTVSDQPVADPQPPVEPPVQEQPGEGGAIFPGGPVIA